LAGCGRLGKAQRDQQQLRLEGPRNGAGPQPVAAGPRPAGPSKPGGCGRLAKGHRPAPDVARRCLEGAFPEHGPQAGSSANGVARSAAVHQRSGTVAQLRHPVPAPPPKQGIRRGQTDQRGPHRRTLIEIAANFRAPDLPPEPIREIRFVLFGREEAPPGCSGHRDFHNCGPARLESVRSALRVSRGTMILLDYIANRGASHFPGRERKLGSGSWARLPTPAGEVGRPRVCFSRAERQTRFHRRTTSPSSREGPGDRLIDWSTRTERRPGHSRQSSTRRCSTELGRDGRPLVHRP